MLSVYRVTRNFPKEELFGLTSQLRRAAISITSNIAEGFNRNSPKEKVQFYSMALGSIGEVQNQLEIARDIGYLEKSHYEDISAHALTAHKLVNGLIKSTRSRI